MKQVYNLGVRVTEDGSNQVTAKKEMVSVKRKAW